MAVSDIFDDNLNSFEREFAEMRKRMMAMVMQNLRMEWHPDEEPETIERRRPRQRRMELPEDEDVEVTSHAKGVEMVMSIPWAKEGDVMVAARPDMVTIAAGGERGFLKEVRLPSRIRPSTCAHTLKNGVLHITAQRQRQGRRPTQS
jgi:HSP20 family molecular chaperone IbpA